MVWYCRDCDHIWEGDWDETTPESCPKCGSGEVTTQEQAVRDYAVNLLDDISEDLRLEVT